MQITRVVGVTGMSGAPWRRHHAPVGISRAGRRGTVLLPSGKLGCRSVSWAATSKHRSDVSEHSSDPDPQAEHHAAPTQPLELRDGTRDGLLLFSVTPPREAVTAERAKQIAAATIGRVEAIGPDAVVLYDITDESDRNADERPFPFLPTMDPAAYLAAAFEQCPAPVVVYRAVGKYPEAALSGWLAAQDTDRVSTVFVGASSRDKQVSTSLPRAYEMRRLQRPELRLGGVTIPERHARTRREHLKLVEKQEQGCSFFVSQIVYDVNAAKNLVSDYRLECERQGVTPAPVIFTFSVIGSAKTLDFMRWLGIEIPNWLENDLTNTDDPLGVSSAHALAMATDLVAYCRRTGMPFGINVESVSARRTEIEAAVELAQQVAEVLRAR